MIPEISTLKVLIVEDQQDARAMLRNMLGEMGINQIYEAGDGRQGLSFVDSSFDGIDLVICDWNMPSMNRR
jgi:two-component system chemotaxis response regulator CheY